MGSAGTAADFGPGNDRDCRYQLYHHRAFAEALSHSRLKHDFAPRFGALAA
jgi:hypothetical protein